MNKKIEAEMETGEIKKAKEIIITLQTGRGIKYNDVYRRYKRDSLEISDKIDFMFFQYIPLKEVRNVSEVIENDIVIKTLKDLLNRIKEEMIKKHKAVLFIDPIDYELKQLGGNKVKVMACRRALRTTKAAVEFTVIMSENLIRNQAVKFTKEK